MSLFLFFFCDTLDLLQIDMVWLRFCVGTVDMLDCVLSALAFIYVTHKIGNFIPTNESKQCI